jgi:hypothetical protein
MAYSTSLATWEVSMRSYSLLVCSSQIIGRNKVHIVTPGIVFIICEGVTSERRYHFQENKSCSLKEFRTTIRKS